MKRALTLPVAGTAVVLILALAAALVPFPAVVIEQYFSQGIYPVVQSVVTSVSNVTPVALLDVAAGALLIAGIFALVRRVRWGGWGHAMVWLLLAVARTAGIIYLLFVVMWGFNYRRVPLEQKMDFDRARVSQDRAYALAAEAVRRANLLYAPAHAGRFDVAALAPPFASAERALGDPGSTRPGRPKHSLLGIYFRKAAVDGMTDPVFLEVIVNPDLLDVERPEVLAHEWAHLAGYADESEANFLAWLTCLRGDPLAQYSGWLSAYRRARSALPRARRAALPLLDEGPRRDLAAIAARVNRSSPRVRQAAHGVYDSYLKAQGIAEGIANYDAVLQLMLGTTLGGTWTPQ